MAAILGNSYSPPRFQGDIQGLPNSRDPFTGLQSILKEINPEYSLEGMMLPKYWSFSLMRRADSLEKTLMLGKIEGKRISGWQRIRWFDSITNSMDMNLDKLPGIVEVSRAWYSEVRGVAKSQT